MAPPPRASLAIAVAFVLATGCDQGPPTSATVQDTSTGREALREFRREAASICARYRNAIAATISLDLERAGEQVERISLQYIERLRRLHLGDRDRERVDSALTTFEQQARLAQAQAEALAQNDRRRFTRLQRRLVDLAMEAGAIPRQYGFEKCAPGNPLGHL